VNRLIAKSPISPAAAPLVVDKNEAARLLAVSPRHVDALAARGLLPKVKLGSACRFRVADIMGMVDRLANGQILSKGDG
jgi:excisionase family DNA binding protein